ncbi:MAG: hypothetical protein LBT09_07220 [Planctomycetaceae bacterium]|nr:hypothetical protein [Planctomycetaceae bacterium]
MFGVIVAIAAVVAIGVYFRYVFSGNSSRGISCNGCPGCPRGKKRGQCSQRKLKNSSLKIYREDDESK